jgi:hypothetical protein
MMAAALVACGGRAWAQTSWAPGAAAGPEPQSIRVNSENVRVNNYLHDLAGPHALIGVIGGSVMDQLRHKNDVDGGLAARFGSQATQAVVQTSVRHGLAALMHRSTDYRFQFCECHGFGPRVAHAFLGSFTDRRDDGDRAFSVPRVAGAYAGSFAGLAWEHDRNAGDALVGTTMSLGFSALFNVAHELSGIGRHKAPEQAP